MAPIQPIYISTAVNAPVLLGNDDDVEIACKNWRLKGRGRGVLRLSPRCNVTLSVACTLSMMDKAILMTIGRKSQITAQFSSLGTAIPVIVTSNRPEGQRQARLELLPLGGPLSFMTGRRRRLKAATFHLINFPDFLPGRIELTDGQWLIEVESLPQTEALVDELAKSGGYAITHVGRLTCTSGKTFAILQMQQLLHELWLFLSFARGLSVGVFGVVGVAAGGHVTYRDWSMRDVTPWQGRFAWFDTHHGATLGEAFPGFAALLRDPHLGKAAQAALYWYLRSNRAGAGPGVDGGIILAQAALERLAATWLDAKKLRIPKYASDKMRLAFQNLGLPLAIPKELKTVHRARGPKTWADIPTAITAIRNDLVHPRQRFQAGKFLGEIWMLCQWCIELFVLRLSGYRGDYSDRLKAEWVGEVRPVPWARRRKT